MDRYDYRIIYPGSESKNRVVKRIVSRLSITEEQFIESYEDIRSAAEAGRGWENWNRSKYSMPPIECENFPILPYAAYNEWAKPENISDNLKLFLKLKGDV